MSRATTLKRVYLAALKKHLEGSPRVASLRAAETLGRQAVAAKLDKSELATIHKDALLALVPTDASSRTSERRIARAGKFFIAALTPLDQTHRAAIEANGHLKRLQKTMNQRSAELADTQHKLKQESLQRKALERALKLSKRQHVELLKKSLRAQQQLRHLSHQVLTAQEEERKRISRELHDEIGQTLTAINVKLATLRVAVRINTKALKKTIVSTQRLVERSMKAVHRFARDLRPPLLDDLGLIPALHAHAKTFTKETGIPVRIKAFAAVEELSGDKRTVLYRVTQEALANVSKHAEASLVRVAISKNEDMVRLEVRDNGKSFDVKRVLGARKITRLGLLGMRERLEMVGGTLEIESTEGTTIRALIPFVGRTPSRRTRTRAAGR